MILPNSDEAPDPIQRAYEQGQCEYRARMARMREAKLEALASEIIALEAEMRALCESETREADLCATVDHEVFMIFFRNECARQRAEARARSRQAGEDAAWDEAFDFLETLQRSIGFSKREPATLQDSEKNATNVDEEATNNKQDSLIQNGSEDVLSLADYSRNPLGDLQESSEEVPVFVRLSTNTAQEDDIERFMAALDQARHIVETRDEQLGVAREMISTLLTWVEDLAARQGWSNILEGHRDICLARAITAAEDTRNPVWERLHIYRQALEYYLTTPDNYTAEAALSDTGNSARHKGSHLW